MQHSITQGSRIMMAQTLRKTHMFSDIPSANLEKLLPGCELLSVPKGNYLFQEGEKAAGFYVVHRGGINVHRVTEDGKEQVIRVFYPGESFGEVVLAGDASYPASAKAPEDSQIILIRTGFFRNQIREDPDFALRILGSMGQHLRFLVETVESLKLQQAEPRLINWLIQLAREQGVWEKNAPVIRLPAAKHLLASQLGITSETFSRVLAKLRQENLIEVDGKTIKVLSTGGLRRFGLENLR